MSNYKILQERKQTIKEKLREVRLENNKETTSCWQVASELKVSGTTVKNYLEGRINDGYLAEAIYAEFQKMGLVK
jgi:predicted transcriptional regulator